MMYSGSLKNKLINCLSFCFLIVFSTTQAETITLDDGSELLLKEYSSTKQNGYLLLWVAPGSGFRKSHQEMAKILQQSGLEVWQTDLLESLFLPKGTASLKSLDGSLIAELIKTAQKRRPSKKIVLLSGSYGAIPVLRGIRQWQAAASSNGKASTSIGKVVGTILFSPSLYDGIPPLGTEPNYLPIAHSSTIPIFIFQGASHGTRWQLGRLVKTLNEGGSQVYTELIPNVGSVFFQQDLPEVKLAFKRMPRKIISRIKILESITASPTAVNLKREAVKGSGLDDHLKSNKGFKTPKPINLKDVYGKPYIKSNFEGQVTVINFWASWCPPCVKEIPSLNNLRKKMEGKPFELISINYAEKNRVISQFMKTVQVDFPVLMDFDGSVSGNWLVIAFPSTFVVAPDGRIVYGVNAAIEWDTEEVLNKINNLYR